MYKQKCVEMRTGRIEKRSTVLFALVTLSAVTLILASEHASVAVVHHTVVVDHKAHTAMKVEAGLKITNSLAYN